MVKNDQAEKSTTYWHDQFALSTSGKYGVVKAQYSYRYQITQRYARNIKNSTLNLNYYNVPFSNDVASN